MEPVTQSQEIEILLKLIAWLVGIIGSLSLFTFSFIAVRFERQIKKHSEDISDLMINDRVQDQKIGSVMNSITSHDDDMKELNGTLHVLVTKLEVISKTN